MNLRGRIRKLEYSSATNRYIVAERMESSEELMLTGRICVRNNESVEAALLRHHYSAAAISRVILISRDCS